MLLKALLVTLTGLILLLAVLFRLKQRRRIAFTPLSERVDALLPQTQCGQCGYSGCMPYAQAIAAGRAEINQCPPGGQTTIKALARLLHRKPIPLNITHGEHKPLFLAKIDENSCIGCTLCLQACPVDAIVGAAKQMHTVIESECTGCELCLPPCPVDCIDMLPAPKPSFWNWSYFRGTSIQSGRKANQARRRHLARQSRLRKEQRIREEKLAKKRAQIPQRSNTETMDDKRATIQAAIKRVKSKKAAIKKTTALPDHNTKKP
ncbi:electron transport complex subunit RsxB [Acidihalobacter prosperus]